MPDIDIDFCYERRQEVIDYVYEKYGKDKVVQIELLVRWLHVWQCVMLVVYWIFLMHR